MGLFYLYLYHKECNGGTGTCSLDIQIHLCAKYFTFTVAWPCRKVQIHYNCYRMLVSLLQKNLLKEGQYFHRISAAPIGVK